MPFSEAVKLEAKERAHFTCVWCREKKNFIDVHHITAQESGGSDELNNAAPLCTACHTLVGGNPELRKQIRERRDWWWTQCRILETRQPDPATVRRQDAAQKCERAIRVCLNMEGVTVNYVHVGDNALELHFTRGQHRGGTALHYHPKELLADPTEIGREAARKAKRNLDRRGLRDVHPNAELPEDGADAQSKRQAILKLGDTVLTVHFVTVGQAPGVQVRECRVDECTPEYVRLYDIGYSTLRSEPLDIVRLSYDDRYHRPLLIVRQEAEGKSDQ